MYSRDVQAKIVKQRVKDVHDWIFSSVPGVSTLTLVSIVVAAIYGSPIVQLITCATFFFLLGNVVGERKRDNEVAKED